MSRNSQKPQSLLSIDLLQQRFALTCSIQLADGRRVSGKIETDSPIRDATVRYSGPVQMLPLRCPSANSLVLRALFRSFAEDLRAQYQEVMIEKPIEKRRNSRHQGFALANAIRSEPRSSRLNQKRQAKPNARGGKPAR